MSYPALGCPNCKQQKEGAHYNIWVISSGGVEGLRKMFPDAIANEMNFALFSTSGVHGTYTTIEQIEQSIIKYGENPDFVRDENKPTPDDWSGTRLTVTVYHPRIIGIGYGNVEVKLDDIPFLKLLRQSSWEAVQKIGRGE
jgi:hypothetical protein